MKYSNQQIEKMLQAQACEISTGITRAYQAKCHHLRCTADAIEDDEDFAEILDQFLTTLEHLTALAEHEFETGVPAQRTTLRYLKWATVLAEVNAIVKIPPGWQPIRSGAADA